MDMALICSFDLSWPDLSQGQPHSGKQCISQYLYHRVVTDCAKPVLSSCQLNFSRSAIMKYCQNCKTRSPDIALFCGRCQSSFAVKICSPGRHINPPTVSFCLTCGSENLSRPDRYPRKISRYLVLLWAVLTVLSALIIAYAIARSLIARMPQPTLAAVQR